MSDKPYFPHNAVVLRFGTNTPYFLLTMSYGIFVDPSTRIPFVSLDHYVGYHMLVRRADRELLMSAPNGYTAYRNLNDILQRGFYDPADPVVSSTWEEDRDRVVMAGLRMKFSQSSCLADMLERTGDRPIFDSSRREEPYWCVADGNGRNAHGRLLERVRAEIRGDDYVPPED